MRKMDWLMIVVIAAALVAGLPFGPCSAQEIKVPRLDPGACNQLQSHIDQVLAISDSASMTDSEKVAALTKAWTDTWKAMQETSKNDSEVSAMVKEFSNTLHRVLAMALSSGSSGGKEVSPDAKHALADLKEQIKPYMSFMKLLCPDLVIPRVLSK